MLAGCDLLRAGELLTVVGIDQMRLRGRDFQQKANKDGRDQHNATRHNGLNVYVP